MGEYNAVYKTESGQRIHINGLYQGASAFLCCSGPSLLQHNLTLLRDKVTLSVNNCPIALREHGGFSPTFWTMTDDVKNFAQSIYTDPQIIKFIPDGKPKHKLWDNNAWRESKLRVRDCPGVIYYSRPPGLEEFFSPATFLDDPRHCWGNHARRCACGYTREDKGPKLCPECGKKDCFGSRSCMLVAIRILYELGFKKVFLVGCDLRMEKGKANYAFSQDRAAGAVRNNNNTYRMLNDRFDALKPLFDKLGFKVWNCYEDSGLRTFPFMPFAEAVEVASVVPEVDRTAGMYDRKANEKAAKKKAEKEKTGNTLDVFLKERHERLAMAAGGSR